MLNVTSHYSAEHEGVWLLPFSAFDCGHEVEQLVGQGLWVELATQEGMIHNIMARELSFPSYP